MLASAAAHAASAQTAPSSPSAAAPPPEHLGDAHQLVIDQSFLLSAAHATMSDEYQTNLKQTELVLNPSLTYFPIKRLSVGARLGVRYMSSNTFGSTFHQLNIDISPTVGFAQPLSEHLYLWPKLGVTVGRVREWVGDPGMNTLYVAPHAEAPLVWSPAEHFFVGVGPTVTATWGKQEDRHMWTKSFGAMTTIGGYFSL